MGGRGRNGEEALKPPTQPMAWSREPGTQRARMGLGVPPTKISHLLPAGSLSSLVPCLHIMPKQHPASRGRRERPGASPLLEGTSRTPAQPGHLGVSGPQTRLRKHRHLFRGCSPFQTHLNDCTFGEVFFLPQNIMVSKS